MQYDKTVKRVDLLAAELVGRVGPARELGSLAAGVGVVLLALGVGLPAKLVAAAQRQRVLLRVRLKSKKNILMNFVHYFFATSPNRALISANICFASHSHKCGK